MKQLTVLTGVILLAVLWVFSPAWALEQMPGKSGFSGFVRPGYGYLDIKTNMVASSGPYDISKRTINSRSSSPRSESRGIIGLPFRLNYTLDNLETQIFIGTKMMNINRLDISQEIGIKQLFDGVGLFQAGLLFSAMGTKVWKDPYLENANRSRTDQDASGIRLVWDKIFESNFEVAYSYRNIDINHDYSARSIGGLTKSQRKRLQRDSDEHILEAQYRFSFGDNKHHLIPMVSYKYDNRDGDALKNDEFLIGLTYTYMDDPITFTVTGTIGQAEYDKRNPIYGKKQDDDIYGVNATIYYKNPWGWRVGNSKPVNLYVMGLYAERSADIDFYYEKASMVSAGMMFRW